MQRFISARLFGTKFRGADRGNGGARRSTRRCEPAGVLSLLRPGPGRLGHRSFIRPWDGVLRGLGGHSWPEPYEFATVPFGKHGGKHQLWRGAGRRRRGDAGHYVTGDPVGHLLAQLGIELCRPGKKLTSDIGLFGAQARKLQR